MAQNSQTADDECKISGCENTDGGKICNTHLNRMRRETENPEYARYRRDMD